MRSDEDPPYRTLPENDPQRNPWELFWGNSIVIIVAPLEIEWVESFMFCPWPDPSLLGFGVDFKISKNDDNIIIISNN